VCTHFRLTISVYFITVLGSELIGLRFRLLQFQFFISYFSLYGLSLFNRFSFFTVSIDYVQPWPSCTNGDVVGSTPTLSVTSEPTDVRGLHHSNPVSRFCVRVTSHLLVGLC